MTLFAILFLIIGLNQGDLEFAAKTATYGNFDVQGTESWIMKLKPGIDDLASSIHYGNFHKTPLIAIGILFILVLFGSIYKNKRDLLKRKLVQWITFMVARLGVFRVSGICPIKRTELGVFPFLNCQACEMATGGCPIGMLQYSLIKKKVPYLVIGVMILSGVLLGRTICGWFCPFGFVSDIFDRISTHKFKPNIKLNYIKYGALILVCSAFLWSFPVFCVFFCGSGKILGILPYYLTTGLSSLKEFFITGAWLKSFLAFHLCALVIYILGAAYISGRWFCRYICPLGAFYGLFNYVTPFKVCHDKTKCTHCGACKKVCPMNVDLERGNFSDITGCIRCGRCTKLCNARKFSFCNESSKK